MEKKVIILVAAITFAILVAGTLLLGKSSTSNKAQYSVEELIGDARHAKGNPQAKVSLVEFADFQCPGCAVAHPYIKALLDQYKDNVYYVYHHFPLAQHSNAFISAEAAEAAGEQNKFWEMFGLLYEKQQDWQDLSKPTDKFVQYAKDLGLNEEQFEKTLEERKFKDVVQKDLESAMKLGIKATPSFYINGVGFTGDFSQLKAAIEKELKNN